MTKMIAVSLMTLSAGVALAGCGESESFDVRTQTTTQSTVTASNSTADATTASGTFKLVPKAPRGSEDVRGTAKLIRSDRGTDASIKLGGLPPNVRYASYVHAGSCDQPDPGGPHFKFDPDGADMPPNEIHLPFTSDRAGNGTAKTRNDQVVPEGEGRSIVVHRAAPELAAGSGESSPA